MIQRLLFDGVNLQRGRRAVSEAIEFPALIDANEAESCLSGMDVAVAWAKIAVNSSVCLRFPPRGLVQLFGLLEDLQLSMDPPLRQYYSPRRRGPRESFKLVEGMCSSSGVAPALKAASFRGPVHETFHMVAVLPGEVKKFPGRQIGRFFPEKSLKAPPHIGTFPWLETIAPSGIPVVVQCLEHFLRNGRIAQPSSSRL